MTRLLSCPNLGYVIDYSNYNKIHKNSPKYQTTRVSVIRELPIFNNLFA